MYGLGLGQKEFMEAAYSGEMLTPSRCGRMDQVSDVLFTINRPPSSPPHATPALRTLPLCQCVAMGAGSVGLMTFDTDGCQVPLSPHQFLT